MSFSVTDFHDLVEMLEARPDWRAELRRLLLTDEILELPGLVRELVEAQKQTEARVEELAEAQKRTEARVEELAAAQERTEAVVRELVQRTGRLESDVSKLRGQALEQRYRECAASYFSPLLRKIRVLSRQGLADMLDEAEDEGRLSAAERREMLAVDLVVRGLERESRAETYLAVEVSGTIDREDVERAADRAALLSRVTGKQTIAVTAGEAMTDRAWDLACRLRVWRVVDGSVTAPEEDA